MIEICTGLASWVESEVVVSVGNSAQVRVVRRCADMAEVVSVAAAGRAQVALVSPGIHGADRAAVDEIRAAGLGVVGVHQPLDEIEQGVLRQWGITVLVPADSTLAELEQAVQAAGDELPQAEDEPAAPIETPTSLDPGKVDAVITEADREGEVIVLWGPHGAPGRTSTAINLAAELSQLGSRVMLIDLDMHAPAVAQAIGLLDEAPGIAASTRLAEAGRLDTIALAGVAPEVNPGLRVLTGLPRADRWPEVRPGAVEAVLQGCRRLADFVLVDIAAALDDDEELSYDTRAPRRNAAALQALADCDRVLVVAGPDPISLQRLIRGVQQLKEITSARLEVVVTKVRSSATGRSPRSKVEQALERFAGIEHVQFVSNDRDAFDAALLAGRMLHEVTPESAARRDVVALAHHLRGDAPPNRRRARNLRAKRG